MELNRRYKFNEEVLIYDGFHEGKPHICKGRVCGAMKGTGIYEFVYEIDTGFKLLFRTPDAIYRSVEEMQADLLELIVE